mmetsp:Transcript_9905/g.14013  ORF Transcript_9905/g.14013 Transcript_9905/m.14013 type:complete len:483 (+) Transcript_9905:214-1662(+)|eukprot:CAMPEP_0184870420 /NCGR_PEP_ID=MMETSP0580-20130426/37388_1 /TAXON_ID=1118495 /ORGANISM="Dactyliosolen fragilissimus" /LENGTH=482 /DNA_ID=CAMNT_0027372469 /DNA_START=194 /DNA_END=1642 /DNA_ORIENTATION=-
MIDIFYSISPLILWIVYDQLGLFTSSFTLPGDINKNQRKLVINQKPIEYNERKMSFSKKAIDYFDGEQSDQSTLLSQTITSNSVEMYTRHNISELRNRICSSPIPPNFPISSTSDVSSQNQYWRHTLEGRLLSSFALLGTWMYIKTGSTEVVCHLIYGGKDGKKGSKNEKTEEVYSDTTVHPWRFLLWSLTEDIAMRSGQDELDGLREITRATLNHIRDYHHQRKESTSNHCAINDLSQEKSNGDRHSCKLSISLLDHRLNPFVQSILQEEKSIHGFQMDYSAPCGMYIMRNSKYMEMYKERQDLNEIKKDSQDNLKPTTNNVEIKIRPLVMDDAEMVNSNWNYKTQNSLSFIQSMIKSERCCCLGLEEIRKESNDRGILENKKKLCSWILQYEEGAVGLLFCREDCRRKGYAQRVVLEAFHTLHRQREDGADMQNGERHILRDISSFLYIVDGNEASEKLFRKLGCDRVLNADWVGLSFDL